VRPTPYQPYGSGVYRRELGARRLADGRVEGELIDDFHHFRARIRHDGERVQEIEGEAPRHPWSTCPGAIAVLQDLVGMPLEGAGSMRATARYTDKRQHCTHLLDAAAIAIASAARGSVEVTYRIAVPDLVEGRSNVELARNGQTFLVWEIADGVIRAPAPFAGHGLRGGLADWAESELDPALAEAVLVLQRACTIAGGRRIDLETFASAGAVRPNPLGQCHTYQPGTLEHADRVLGSVRNLTHVEDLHLASLSDAQEGEG
jgi:hypothetical protein